MGSRAVFTFAGPPTDDLDALDRDLSKARRVRITRGGFLVYAVDPEADVLDDLTAKYVSLMDDTVLADVAAQDDLQELRQALRVSRITDFECMCPGDLALEFLDDRKRPVQVVRFDDPDKIEASCWSGHVQLAEPERLHRWLQRHGVALGEK